MKNVKVQCKGSLSLLDSNLKYDLNLKSYFCEVKS